MNLNFLITAVAGPLIAGAVSGLKRFKPIERNPKITALVAAVGVAALQQGFSYHGVDVAGIVTQVLVPFAGSVATYEVASNGLPSSTPK